MTAVESSDEKMPPNEAESAVSNAAATKMDPETEPLNAGATADPKVKFTGGSETVDVEKGGVAKANDVVKAALTKAELMKYATDPFWVRMRWILFVLFWIIWTGMLVGSIVIIIMAPKCPSPPPKSWWQKRPFYQVDVESFKDSNGDTKGDLNGILEKADYLDKDVGVGSICLSPIFKSSDYKDVDVKFGTLEDFKNLVDGMHKREIKVILDLFPTHTAAQTEELSITIQFWIDQGVDGFRVPTTGYTGYDLEQTLDLLQGVREVLDGGEEDAEDVILMTNVAPSEDITQFYGLNVTDQVGTLSQMPVRDKSFLPDTISAENLKTSIDGYINELPNNAWPTFSLGKHGQSRVATRTSPKLVNFLNMLLMMLPGTPITYFGEEIGMEDGSGALMKWNPEATAEAPEAPEAVAEENSPVKMYKKVSDLRDSEVLLFGTLETRVFENVFILARLKKGNPGYLLITNFGDTEKTVSVFEKEDAAPEDKNPIAIANTADKGILTICTPENPNLPIRSSINMEEIAIPPGTTYLVTFVPNY